MVLLLLDEEALLEVVVEDPVVVLQDFVLIVVNQHVFFDDLRDFLLLARVVELLFLRLLDFLLLFLDFLLFLDVLLKLLDLLHFLFLHHWQILLHCLHLGLQRLFLFLSLEVILELPFEILSFSKQGQEEASRVVIVRQDPHRVADSVLLHHLQWLGEQGLLDLG